MKSVGTKTYSQAVKEGKYDLYVGNLFGKYDNVRTYWEDQLTRIALRPFLRELVEKRRQEHQGIRILDLGCGSGQGYDILTKTDYRDLDLGLQHKRVLPEQDIELYLGLDISEAMVEKGQAIFADQPRINFAQADLEAGLGNAKKHPPFDIYFSSYASLSHLSWQGIEQLLGDICEHSRHDSLVVLDFLGRYSIEWPKFWQASSEPEKVCDYTMSYLYSENQRQHIDIEHFPVRLWTGQEITKIAADTAKATGVKIEVMKLMDRSVLVGRHTDTREYNQQLQPTRRLANSLHEDYLRTNLQELMIDPTIVPEQAQVSLFYRQLIECWNILVEYCQQRLWQSLSLTELEGWDRFPKSLQFSLMTIDRVIADVGWMWHGDPRANIIEPQLGYALRTLEYEMQQGLGCGHGLVGILRIQK